MASIPDRYVQRVVQEYHDRFRRLPGGIPPLPGPDDPSVTEDFVRKTGKPFSIGIIGAGAAGLFAGMVLERMNAHLVKSGREPIFYEILEAETPDGGHPIGGRLWTHRFSEAENDYYDRGAMRFPEHPIQEPVFELFEELGLKDRMIPYIMSIKDNINLFNSTIQTNKEVEIKASEGNFDAFNTGVAGLTGTVDDMINNQLDYFRKPLAENFDEGFNLLMKYDRWSARGYMTTVGSPTAGTYSDQIVDYLETFSVGTGMYNQALSETVLDTMQFDPPDTEDLKWWTIQGGISVIAAAMAKKIPANKILNGKRVTALAPIQLHHKTVGVEVIVQDERLPRQYSHVITTTSLGALRMMDTTCCSFSWDLQSAIRSLTYDDSTKVGIKFKERWWEKCGQIGGISRTDRPTRVVVYPSYGIHGSDATILVSYTWAQDASRQGSFTGSKEKEALLVDVILRDLAEMHQIPYHRLSSLVEKYDIWSWYDYENTVGAYALFGPGQFSRLYREVTKPALQGRLHFAGELTSRFHAWVLGAIRSANRALKEICIEEQAKRTFGDLGTELYDIIDESFSNPELDRDLIYGQVALGVNEEIDVAAASAARASFMEKYSLEV